MSCYFCELPSDHQVVYENKLIWVIRSKFPVSLGHTLIIPREHISSCFDLSNAVTVEMMYAVYRYKCLLDIEFKPNGYNVGFNDGVAAGQTVMHAHLHLIPRYDNDTPDPRGGIRNCIPGKGIY